jgi:lipopolysaccharide transport system ATP-binding protein
MRVRIHYEARRPVRYPNFYLGIRRADNLACCSFSAARDGVTIPFLDRGGVIELLTPPLRLVSDLYSTFAVVWDHEFKNLYCGQIGPNFHVRDEVLNQHFGVFHVPGEWRWGVNGHENVGQTLACPAAGAD